MYEKGQVYTFEGKNYRYLGGDPKDRGSWELVQGAPEAAQDTRFSQRPPAQRPEDVQPSEEEQAAQLRLNERGGSAIGDLLRMMAQGGTFGFADEIAGLGAGMVPGGQSYEEARDESRQRVEDLRRLAPGGSMLAEIAGGLPAIIAPIYGGTQAIGRGAGLLRTAAEGAAIGGAEAGLFAMGEAEGSILERAEQALPAAGIGAGVGGAGAAILPRVLNTILGPKAGRGTRVAETIREVVPETSEDVAQTTRRLGRPKVGTRPAVEGRQVRTLASRFYDPLEEAYEEITDPGLIRVIRDDDVLSSSKLARRLADEEQAPSFRQVQLIRQNVRDAASRANPGTVPQTLDELNDALRQAIPEMRQADFAYSVAMGQQEAYQLGRRISNQDAGDIQLALENVARKYADDPGLLAEEQALLRKGIIDEWLAKMTERETSPGSILNKMMDAGPEMKARLRAVLPEEGYDEVMRAINEERSAEAVRSTLQKWGRWVLPGLIGGSAGYVVARGAGGG